jgi:hypothetical protein
VYEATYVIPAKYESVTHLIHSDSFGRLYQRNLGDDEPILVVELQNKTPEP